MECILLFQKRAEGEGKLRIEKEFILREIAGDYVIVPTGKTALEFNGLITVNELGAFIWEKMQQDISEDELVEAILDEYEVTEDTARNDVEEFLNKLTECKILEERHSSN